MSARLTIARLLGVGLLVGCAATASAKGKQGSGAPDSAPLVEVLRRHGDPLKRESAALLLGLARNRSAIPALKHALHKDSSRWVRARAAEAMGRLGRPALVTELKRALGREKQQTVRRSVAGALLRLGDRAGLLELMWQLRSGRNHDKAQAMRQLVAATGAPLGQDIKGWWSYLAARGYRQLATRNQRWRQLAVTRATAWPSGKRWRRLCVTTLDVGPTRRPLTARLLRRAVRRRGGLDDGCLILLRSAWRQAKPLPRRTARRAGQSALPADAAPPALTLEGLRYLLKQAPKLIGVAFDGPRLDLPGPGTPVRRALRKRGAIGLVDVTAPSWLVARQRAALAVRLDGSIKGKREPRVLVLVAQP
jgi:hypothetical protein